MSPPAPLLAPPAPSPHRFSVAPMMDWTDSACRVFHRLLSRRARLYTEMVTAEALLRGDARRLLAFDAAEHPVALQVGGCDPARLAAAARLGEEAGFDEVNLNVGCPSERVRDGAFGARLMREPLLVGDCVAAMRAAVRVPVTVKCRLGVDEQDPAEALPALVAAAVAAGADAVVVHARKAWLKGLSPKENREVPPLDYEAARAVKARWPGLAVALNGGIATVPRAAALLAPHPGGAFDGVMMGRAAYHDPEQLLAVDPLLFGRPAPLADGFVALEAYAPHVAARLAAGDRLPALVKPLLGLFPGRPGARAYRRRLSEGAVAPGAGVGLIAEAAALVSRDAPEARAA